MKNFYMIAVLAICAFTVTAQRSVTFSVDLITAGITPAEVVTVAGNFQNLVGGAIWTPGTILLTDADGNGVYSTTVEFSTTDETAIEFKYLNGPTWGNCGENVQECLEAGLDCVGGPDNNRTIVVTAGTEPFVLPVYVYNTCDLSALTISSSNDRALSAGMNLSPNPATTGSVLTFDNNDQHTVTISNLAGQTLSTTNNVQGSMTIDRGMLTEGIYFVTATNTAGERGTLKLVIR